MKKKIFEALKTEYASLGLSDNTLNRIAAVLEGSVEKEEDIATAVKGDTAKLLAKSIQGEIDGIQKAKQKAEADLADYKAKHPEQDPDQDPKQEPKQEPDLAKAIADAIAAAVAPLTEKITALENAGSAKEAFNSAKERFFAGDYAKKYGDEASDAWERATELNEATGSKMTADELVEKASGYFNKAVSRKGVDTSKPFQADPPKDDEEGTVDWSAEKKRLQESGRLPEDK